MRIVEAITERLRWEMDRGKGGSAPWPSPVSLEPRFSPFHHEQRPPRKGKTAAPPGAVEADPIPPSALNFLTVRLSPQDRYESHLSEQQLLALSPRHPVAFEMVGKGGRVSLQLVAAGEDASNLAGQVHAHYPRAQVFEGSDPLAQDESPPLFARSYCLRDSHLFQLRTEDRRESFTPLAGILAGLGEDELGLYQVLFQPVRHPWHENILRVAGDPWDPSKSAFVDLPDLPRKARSKVECPLFAVAVRLAATSQAALDRLEGGFLCQLDSGENGLEAAGPGYPQEAVRGRFTRTPGMLLNVRELAALAHLPDPGAAAEGMETAAPGAPPPRQATEGFLAPLGRNDYRGKETPVGIPEEQLTRHLSILGGTGSGKTNLMKVAFAPLLDRGYGMAVIDPKGDLAQGFLDLVPEHRVDDVVWFDPTDREHPPALNVLYASSGMATEELTSQLMIGLKRLFHGGSEFGPRMEWILRTAVRTLLESRGEKTLYDIARFLEEEPYRKEVLETVPDRQLRDFWQRRTLSRGVIDPVLNRLSHFLDRPAIRDVVSQPNRIDFPQVMREGKIFIANLEKGRLQEAAYILGSFLLSRLQLAALARRPGERGLFPVLVDEFHNFAGHGMDTESIETFLSETRSYRAPLVVSTQYLARLHRGVMAALFGNLGTQVCLNMGPDDARSLQRELGRFTAEDLINLGIGRAIVRMGPARDTFNVEIPLARERQSHRETIIRRSRERYCQSRANTEESREEAATPETPEPRTWVVDAQGAVFTPEQHREYMPEPAEENAKPEPATPVRETEAEDPPSPPPDDRVDKELLEYMEHVARHPFLPALQRDKALNLSRYKGGLLRQRLTGLGLVRQHKASTGKRSGQLALLEVTEEGYQALSSMKIRVQRPRGRGGFLHRYYAHKLREYAEATWKGCDARIEDASRGRPADVTVRMPGESGHTVAFEIFMTGEDKEITGIARDVKVFDRVIVCAASQGAVESLQARAMETLGEEVLPKVEFHLVSHYLLSEAPRGESRGETPDSPGTSRPSRKPRPRKTGNQKQKSASEVEKSRPGSETETEEGPPSGRKAGRRPKTPLLDQVQEAYRRIHDWDWLADCDLAKLPEVREHTNPRQIMPEAQALRGLLLEAAQQVVQDLATVPDKSGARVFLERHLEGRNVTEIARELGVSREWVARGYRREALRLAGMQFVRLVSRES